MMYFLPRFSTRITVSDIMRKGQSAKGQAYGLRLQLLTFYSCSSV
jgi:hypothetical protein